LIPLRKPDGELLLWRPDWASSPAAKRMEQEAEKAKAEAEKHRQRVRDTKRENVEQLRRMREGGMFGAEAAETQAELDADAEGLVEPGNIDLTKRPVVKNDDGSISTVRSMSFNDGPGRDVLIPTVSDDGRIMSDKEAIETFRRTGRHLGIFDTPEHATAYAERLHEQQERLFGKSRKPSRRGSAVVPGGAGR